MSWTTDQKKAIEKTNDNVIVTASAGCGKTSTMIERAYNLMKNGTPVRRMTLLTFTEAAAKEMKEKLRKRLYEEIKTVVTAEERAALMEQIDDLPYANISTIHGYCYQLVREFFEQIPLSPSVRIIEEDAANELMYKAFDALIEEKEKLREETGDDSFYDLRMMVNLRKDDDLFDLLKNIYERMTNQPDREKWLWDIYNDEYGVDFENTRLAKYFYALIHDKAVEIRQGVESLVLTIKSEVPKYEKETYWKHVVRLDEYVRKYADATSVKEILAAYREIADEAHRFYPCKPYPNFNLWKEAYVSFLKERVKGVAELGTYEELVKRHMGSAGFVKQLCDLTLEFAALYAKQKKELPWWTSPIWNCTPPKYCRMRRYARKYAPVTITSLWTNFRIPTTCRASLSAILPPKGGSLWWATANKAYTASARRNPRYSCGFSALGRRKTASGRLRSAGTSARTGASFPWSIACSIA